MFSPQAPDDAKTTLRPRAFLIVQDDVVEPRRAIEQRLDVGSADRNQPRFWIAFAHGSNGRRGHDHVADPVRQKKRDPVHAAFIFSTSLVVE